MVNTQTEFNLITSLEKDDDMVTSPFHARQKKGEFCAGDISSKLVFDQIALK